jgi:hypothetical protein
MASLGSQVQLLGCKRCHWKDIGDFDDEELV